MARSPDPMQLVVLMTCRDQVEAMGVRSLLESEGIEVLVQGEHHRALEGALLGALRVMVRRRELDDARELLEEAAYAEHLPPDADDAPIEDNSVLRFREQFDDPDAEAPTSDVPARKPAMAVALALLLPFGTGHMYARRHLTGVAIGIALLVNFTLWLRGWFVLPAVVALVAFDAIWSSVAVRRDLQRRALDAPSS